MKVFRFWAVMVRFFLETLWVRFTFRGRANRRLEARERVLEVIQNSAIRALDALGIEVYPIANQTSAPADASFLGRLIVSNHVSYLDALVIAAVFPAVFVTSVEVRDMPFLGWVARLGGCVFVERRKRVSVPNDIDRIAEVLREGSDVVLFPEATSSNGDRVLEFRSSLVEAAVRAKTLIQPLCIRYRKLDGKDLTAESRDQLFYYGDMTFFPHLARLFKIENATVELEILKPIPCDLLGQRKQVAAHAYAAIQTAYLPPLPPIVPL